MRSISALSLVRNGEVDERPPDGVDVESDVRQRTEALLLAVRRAATHDEVSFKAFERLLVNEVMALARAAVVLFLALAEERVARTTPRRIERGDRVFRLAPPQARNLNTMFGVVRYWRTYMREVALGDRRGFHPLDVALGLTADRVSMTLMALAVRLATKLSFAEARTTLSWFVPTAPSTEVIENAVLGMGRHTAKWFEHAPAPDGDGDVLVIMFDSKGAPTATETELARRRGKRRKRPHGPSPRHRGRNRRSRHEKKPRRKKGDHSKNAKMATMFVMFTFKREGGKLLGPINRRVYASFGPKEHAFVIARREADKRGFAKGSGKLVQIVTDGDDDLACYTARHFPEAIHTVDVMHVIEKLWRAGECIFREGSDELLAWVTAMKDWLYTGHAERIVSEVWSRLDATPTTGPGNKGKRERLDEVACYLGKRVAKMNYHQLLAQDLEIGTGAIEGAIKNVIGKRCDHGGMRWIKERAEALLQLRCIEINGDWDAFVDRVHNVTQRRGIDLGLRERIQHDEPAPLPEIARAA